ncbi:MAG TPA: serine/threonine-protein kinase [Vicinamibacteria bacterium]|nr:serine/threonine-protein kinase [Vicinamibacteria bacterium]
MPSEERRAAEDVKVVEPLPEKIGRYEVRRELGRGAMGVVYEAWDPALDRRVAVKTLSLAASFGPIEREAFEQRFLTEARAAAGLSHPNIVVVHDVGRDGAAGVPYITLEYLEGRTLAELAAAGDRLDWREALRIVARLADALHTAHSQGIVHRDVKPANVMLLPNGQPKIMDFGIAKVPASQLTAAGQLFGTPANMSPEQALGEPLDARSDLFSLGTVLYELLTGRRPFFADTLTGMLAQVVQQDPPPPRSLAPGLPADADYLSARSLAKAREQRYPDGRSLAEDIEDLLGGRLPRHRGGWREARASGTVVSRPRATLLASPASGLETVEADSPLVHLLEERHAGPPRRLPRRVVLLAAGMLGLVSLVVLGVWLLRPKPKARLLEAPSRAAAMPATTVETMPATAGEGPARLAVEFDHRLRSGVLKLWFDDDLVLEQKLEGRVSKKILSFRLRKGSLDQMLEVTPGRHKLRVNVSWDGNSKNAWLSGTFLPGEQRTLEVSQNLITKDISLDWR